MVGGYYVLLINLSMAAIFAGVFLFAYSQDRRRTQALFWLTACGLVMTNGVIEAAMPQLYDMRVLRVFGHSCFMAALGLLAVGFSRQFKLAFPWGPALTIFAGSMLINIAILDMPRNAPLRLHLYHGPYFLMASLSALILLRVRQKGVLEYLLLAVISAMNLHFLLRPAAIKLLGGMGDSPRSYLSTSYAAYDQTVLAIVALSLASLMSLVLVRDVIRGLTKVSVTDPLSGLMNRRGFLESAQKFLRPRAAEGQEVYLAIADIDHFKAINDSHGHDIGDKVIRAFGQMLESVANPGACVARLGGEEFAVLFRAPSPLLARMHCENLRALAEAGAGAAETGLPSYTASFGLACLMPGETFDSLASRADQALYGAKHAGRNCVSLADAGPEAETLAA